MTPAELERELALYRGLLEVSHLINGATDSTALMRAILEVAQRVLDAEAGGLFLVDPQDGDLVLRVALAPSGISVPEGRIVVPRDRGVAGWVARHCQPALVPDAYADPRFFREADQRTGFRTRSIVCVPLRHEGQDIGVLQMLNPKGKPSFEPADLEALSAYGQLAATAYARMQVLEERQRQALLHRELDLAADIQRGLLPASLPAVPGARCDARYVPARHVGGDFYSARLLGPEVLWFVIGDVAGKGIPASLRMAQALGILHAILDPDSSPSLAMDRWNRALCAQGNLAFVTATLGRWSGDGRLELAVAGHPDPWVIPAKRPPHRVRLAGGPPIGLFPDAIHPLATIEPVAGDQVLFYTDGLSESRSAGGMELDDDALAAALVASRDAPGPFLDRLLEAENRHRGAAPARDDLTLFLLSCNTDS